MQRLYRWEKRVIFKLNQQDHPGLDRVMLAVSKAGNGGAIWIVIGLWMIFAGWRLEGILMLAALADTAFLVNLVVKPMFTRRRPYELFQSIKTRLRPPYGSSFPSGHAASSFAAASMLFFLHVPFWYLALALACLIALSRIHLLVHFPTDVLVGILSGIILSYLTFWFAMRMGFQDL